MKKRLQRLVRRILRQAGPANRQQGERGFTLIELMIVVALIGILAGMFMENMTSSLGVARDARRKADLRKLENALTTYYVRNSSYPVTAAGTWFSSELGDATVTPTTSPRTDWIPGLAPLFVPKLPKDPKGGSAGTTLDAACGTRRRAYLYRSDDGTSFSLLAFCSMEGGTWGATDSFYDASRATYAWKVCSSPISCAW